MIKAIKGVSDESWQEFKALANREHVPMGKLLEEMIERRKEHHANRFWQDLFNTPKALTDEEAEGMLEIVRKLRQERGWRD